MNWHHREENFEDRHKDKENKYFALCEAMKFNKWSVTSLQLKLEPGDIVTVMFVPAFESWGFQIKHVKLCFTRLARHQLRHHLKFLCHETAKVGPWKLRKNQLFATIFLYLLNFYLFWQVARVFVTKKMVHFKEFAKVLSVKFLSKSEFAKLKFAKCRDFLTLRKFLPAKVSALKVAVKSCKFLHL